MRLCHSHCHTDKIAQSHTQACLDQSDWRETLQLFRTPVKLLVHPTQDTCWLGIRTLSHFSFLYFPLFLFSLSLFYFLFYCHFIFLGTMLI